MKKLIAFGCALLLAMGAISNPNKLQAQEYYDPSAPVTGTDTGVNLLVVGGGLLVVGAVAAIIIATSDSGNHHH